MNATALSQDVISNRVRRVNREEKVGKNTRECGGGRERKEARSEGEEGKK